MGPLTRATVVSRLIADHIAAAEAAAWPPVNARAQRPGRHGAFASPSLVAAAL